MSDPKQLLNDKKKRLKNNSTEFMM